MRRREAAILAHLDAIETRLTNYLVQILTEMARIREDIAGIKLEAATHSHGEES